MRLPGDLQLLRLQGKSVLVARKLRYHADREFRDLYTPPDS